MKILLLSCNTGQGHNAAAAAVAEEFERRGVACETRDALAFMSELTSRAVSGTYMRMATDAPKVFGGMYRVASAISNTKVKSPVYAANLLGTRAMGRYIRENGIDAVVTSHLFAAESLTYLKKHGRISARTYLICTDYTCHPFSEETDMDGYFIAHSDLTGEYVERGVPRGKLIPTGIPVSGRFLEHTDRTEARRRLEIPADARMFLVMTGSMGYGGAAEMARMIARDGCARSLVCVMTGKNEALRAEVQEIADSRVRAVPFTKEVPLYMSAADVLLTKPGGLTSTESAVARIPTVFSAPIPGCETANAQFFRERGMAVCAGDAESAARAALWLAADEEKRTAMLAAQARYINPRAAADVCDRVIGDCTGE